MSTQNQPAQVVLLRIGAQALGVPITSVQEIRGWEPVTPLPGAPAFVPGVFSLRGEVVTVVDLGQRLGLGPHADPQGGVVIVVEHDGRLAGLLCDSVSDIAGIEDGQLRPVPEQHQGEAFLSGLVLRHDAIVGLVDLAIAIGSWGEPPAAKAA